MPQYQLFYKEEETGPYEPDHIQGLIDEGAIDDTAQVWSEGMDTWVPIMSVFREPISSAPSAVEQNQKPKKQPYDAGAKVEDSFTKLATKLSLDEQDPAAVARILNKSSGILTKNEQVDYVAVQKKPVVTVSPDAILLTNKRLIIVRPKLTGFSFTDIQWREVDDVHLSEQMMGATISCVVTDGRILRIDSLPKKQARRIYSYAQEMEEKMIEFRRSRELEDSRAAAGGIIMQGPVGAAPSGEGQDPLQQLEKLKQMLSAELISQSEFDTKKTEILSRM